MKKLLVLFVAVLACTGAVSAQNYMVVDSEKIFKSLSDYNAAISTLDAEAKTAQEQVDARFKEVETLYNSYKQQQGSLSEASRAARERLIVSKENEATTYQESVFGQEGTLIARRKALIEPIQKRVFASIETYAKAHGFALVLDRASNPTLLYSAPSVDKTAALIEVLK